MYRHGFFARRVADEAGTEIVIWVMRMRCQACLRSFSLLYDLLIPYRRYTVKALETAVMAFFVGCYSYAEALWTSSESETRMVCSTLYRAVLALTERVWLAQQQLQTAVLESGGALPAVETEGSIATKARSPVKGERLRALIRLFALADIVLQKPVLQNLNSFFAMRSEHKFPLFSIRKGLRLSAPHYAQQQLF
jgi:Domain of unknown function (DUF6431)